MNTNQGDFNRNNYTDRVDVQYFKRPEVQQQYQPINSGFSSQESTKTGFYNLNSSEKEYINNN